MEAKILGWTIQEIADLVSVIKNNDSGNMVNGFEKYAKSSGRKTYSVRNFFYRLINLASQNDDIADLLKANKVELPSVSHFEKEEEENILRTLLVDNGKSVRNTCFELSNGDVKQAIRLQNKYRNLIKQNNNLVTSIRAELEREGKVCRKINNKNIIKLNLTASQNIITEKEIQSLFWGLVRLVKRSAEEELEMRQNFEMKMANSKLQETAIDLKRKEVLIRELREQNKSLNLQINKYKSMIDNNMLENSNNYIKLQELAESNQMKKLKNFVSELIEKQERSYKK